jgi:transcriptional regulator with XRE-family HTH domain
MKMKKRMTRHSNPDLFKNFGKNVQSLRKSQHLSQTDLSKRTGLAVTYISQMERGISNPCLNNLMKLAVGLKVELSKILERIEE